MKREIKFRVWDGKKHHYPECTEEKTNHYLQFGSKGVFYLHSAEGDLVSSFNNGVCEQFTGLKDKNGVEIYESDVLNFGNNNHVAVVFENGCFCVFNEPLGWDFDSENGPVKTDFMYCEVVGNIHENPELIKT